MNKFAYVLFFSLCLSSCSIVPYEEDYACNFTDNLGKCIPMDEAYNEAVTKKEKYSKLRPASEQDEDEEGNKKAVRVLKPESELQRDLNLGLDLYTENYYNELNNLIVDPVTPLVKQAKTLRTLTLPYSGENARSMYGERYIYTIVAEPSFVMGQYLIKDDKKLETLMPFKQE